MRGLKIVGNSKKLIYSLTEEVVTRISTLSLASHRLKCSFSTQLLIELIVELFLKNLYKHSHQNSCEYSFKSGLLIYLMRDILELSIEAGISSV